MKKRGKVRIGRVDDQACLLSTAVPRLYCQCEEGVSDWLAHGSRDCLWTTFLLVMYGPLANRSLSRLTVQQSETIDAEAAETSDWTRQVMIRVTRIVH
jgi:hypothetical protein